MKTILITGGTSGFGRAAVERFHGAGWRVIATGRRGERLDALADALIEAYAQWTVAGGETRRAPPRSPQKPRAPRSPN